MKHTFTLLSALLLAALAPAAEPPFPFVISGLDATPAALDLSGLNEKPAGKSGFVRAEGEYLVDGAGQRLRLFGTNLVAGANFPEPSQAPLIAGHLAKMGVNVVRLHFLENHWGDPQSSLLPKSSDTKLDEANLAKLDGLLAELIKQGVYINLNLHVGREYPGTPQGMPANSKGLDLFHQPYIDGLKDYARQLLNHVNPHTGRAYKDEPGIAVVEINNENCLILNPWWMETLPEPFAGELRGLWETWAKTKYQGDIAKLQAAWGLNDGKTGAELIPDPNFAKGKEFWYSEAHQGAEVSLSPLKDGAPGARFQSTKTSAVPWGMQLSCNKLKMETGKQYRLSFRARADQEASCSVNASQAGGDYNNLGLNADFPVTPKWVNHFLEFSATEIGGQPSRMVFSLKNQLLALDLADVSLQEIPTGFLKPKQSFDARNIPTPKKSANSVVRRDFFEFLAQTELDYYAGIRRFLKEELGVKCPVSGSQVMFGGLLGARREALASDIVDTHGYWQHPSFPRKQWDLSDWTITNTPQLAEPNGGTLAEMAMQRPFGKPYSVSEYDVPAPNDTSAETFPLLAAMASFQGWSAIYQFAWAHGQGDYKSDKMHTFFNVAGHTGKHAFVPAAAAMFRLGLIPEEKRLLTMEVSRGTLMQDLTTHNGDTWGSWRRIWDLKRGGAWTHRAGIKVSEDEAETKVSAKERANDFSKNSLMEVNYAAKVFTLHAPAARAAIGQIGGKMWALDDVSLTIPSFEGLPNATSVLVALDGKPVKDSQKLLLTALRYTENAGVQWNKDRTTVGTNWGNGPTTVIGLDATLKLPGGKVWKVEPLNPAGQPMNTLAERTDEFTISPAQKTVWWLISR